MRARTEGLRDFGACLSPTNAFQLLQGVETLGVAHGAPSRQHPRGARNSSPPTRRSTGCCIPSLESHPDYALAKRLLPRGAGSIVSFGIKGGRPAGKKFIEALRMVSHLANVGDAKTLVIHPACTTHQQMDAAQLQAAGIGEELVRLSVGIETAADILDDLGQALRVSQKACEPCSSPSTEQRFSSPTGGRDFDAALPDDRAAARRRFRSHRLGAAQPLVRPSRLWRAGAGSARPRPLLRRAAGSIAEMADWTAALLDAAGASAARLVGHSMGSLIALETAARHPAKVSGLALIGTAASMGVGPDLLKAAEANDHAAVDMVSIWGLGFRCRTRRQPRAGPVDACRRPARAGAMPAGRAVQRPRRLQRLHRRARRRRRRSRCRPP